MSLRAEPIVLPRGLIFLAALWLIGSWFAAMGLHRPVYASSASYAPGVRLMLMSIVIGLMVGWPLLRLSQRRTSHAAAQTLLDLFVLIALVQVVVWMLRLVTPWSPLRMAAIDAIICGWAVLTGAIVASAVGSKSQGPRCLAMLVCLGLLLGGPAALAMGLALESHDLGMLLQGPILAVRSLTEPGHQLTGSTTWWSAALLGAAGGAAWLALGVFGLFRQADSGVPAASAIP